MGIIWLQHRQIRISGQKMTQPETSQAFQRLLNIMDDLRAQCPWDKKQTMLSLRPLTLEESYELADAIIQQDMSEIKKELGDLLLHIVFYAKIAAEQHVFDINDVINSVCDKLVFRHPHIYADVKVADEAEVKRNWERLKQQEKAQTKTTQNDGVLSGVPHALPALIKAWRIQQKAHGIGFDWPNKQQAWQKVEEELHEFKQEYNHQAKVQAEKAEAEFGDLLFSLVNFARFVHIDPETALEKTNRKFIQRFQFIEQQAQQRGQKIEDLSLAQMDAYWEQAKKQ